MRVTFKVSLSFFDLARTRVFALYLPVCLFVDVFKRSIIQLLGVGLRDRRLNISVGVAALYEPIWILGGNLAAAVHRARERLACQGGGCFSRTSASLLE